MTNSAICGSCGSTESADDTSFCLACGEDDWIEVDDLSCPEIMDDYWAKIVKLIQRTNWPVLELCLCEQKHLILKPDQLYLFRVDENCEQCKVLHVLGKEKT